MKKNDFRQNFLQQTGACVLVIGSLALTGDAGAAMATGTARATVLESVSVTFSSPFSGTTFTAESFTGSLSPRGPLLRVGSNPPPVVMGAAVPSTVDGGATVNLTRNADGSMSVSGGSGLTFIVSRPGVGLVNIVYN